MKRPLLEWLHRLVSRRQERQSESADELMAWGERMMLNGWTVAKPIRVHWLHGALTLTMRELTPMELRREREKQAVEAQQRAISHNISAQWAAEKP